MPRREVAKLEVERLIDRLAHEARSVVYTIQTDGTTTPRSNDDASGPTGEPLPALTQRERDVLAGLGRGEPAKQTALKLGISVHTCRGYIKSLHAKLGARSQVEAVLKAQALGLLDRAA